MVGDYGIWVGKHISRPSFLSIVCGRSSFHITRITFHITHLSLKCVTGLNVFRHIMHSKSVVMNIAEPS